MKKNIRIDLYVGLSIILIAVIYSLYYKYKREKIGVITVARIEKFKPAEQGGDLYITIFYEDKQYETIVNVICSSCKSRYYFVKIFADNPAGNPLFYENRPVPDCILSNVKFYKGWKTFPTCDDVK